MVKVGLYGGKVSLWFGGNNFQSIRDVLTHTVFQWDADARLWLAPTKFPGDVRRVLDLINGIERVAIPDDVEMVLQAHEETEHYRINLSDDCFKAPAMYDFQTEAIKRMIRQTRMLLALKQGLGKTFVTITSLNHYQKYGIIKKVLVLCRPEGVINLKREFLKFSTIFTEDDIYIADVKHRTPFESGKSLVIMTYRTLLMLADSAYRNKNKRKIKTFRKDPLDEEIKAWAEGKAALILDESHSCAHSTSRWTREVMLASDKFKVRFCLSGTPYPHGMEGLWAQMYILDPGAIGESYYTWLNEICFLGDRWSEYAIRGYSPEGTKEWAKKLSPWIIREFDDKLELPPQVMENAYFDLSDKHRDIYQSFISYVMTTNRTKNGKIVMREIYDNFPYIQMALTEPGLLKNRLKPEDNPILWGKIQKWNPEKDNNRIATLDSILEDWVDEQGKKVIVWSSHPYVLDLLEKHLSKYHPKKVHGQMTIPKGKSKQEYVSDIVEEFKTDPKSKVLLASILMLSTSQNIVEASRTVYFDRTWSYTDLDQSIKRNYRIGTTEQVDVKFLIADRTLDERQDRVLKERDCLDKELLKYDSLTPDQWRQVFSGGELD